MYVEHVVQILLTIRFVMPMHVRALTLAYMFFCLYHFCTSVFTMDVCGMDAEQFPTAKFDVVVDKGTCEMVQI
jgi:hypothetical protein